MISSIKDLACIHDVCVCAYVGIYTMLYNMPVLTQANMRLFVLHNKKSEAGRSRARLLSLSLPTILSTTSCHSYSLTPDFAATPGLTTVF